MESFILTFQFGIEVLCNAKFRILFDCGLLCQGNNNRHFGEPLFEILCSLIEWGGCLNWRTNGGHNLNIAYISLLHTQFNGIYPHFCFLVNCPFSNKLWNFKMFRVQHHNFSCYLLKKKYTLFEFNHLKVWRNSNNMYSWKEMFTNKKKTHGKQVQFQSEGKEKN